MPVPEPKRTELSEADDDQLPKSALAWQLPERLQMPSAIRRRRFPAQDVEIAVICTDFVKGILRAVPLVQYFLDHVLASRPAESEPAFRPPSARNSNPLPASSLPF